MTVNGTAAFPRTGDLDPTTAAPVIGALNELARLAARGLVLMKETLASRATVSGGLRELVLADLTFTAANGAVRVKGEVARSLAGRRPERPGFDELLYFTAVPGEGARVENYYIGDNGAVVLVCAGGLIITFRRFEES